ADKTAPIFLFSLSAAFLRRQIRGKTRKCGSPAFKTWGNKNGSAEHLKFLLLRPYHRVETQQNRVSTPDVYIHILSTDRNASPDRSTVSKTGETGW
ncbi:MAG: hypothetical protein J6J31_12090, partial [Thermoguttaceae bacterium]|nr:hypothetical protein [Thermoguttaceae bacterium]